MFSRPRYTIHFGGENSVKRSNKAIVSIRRAFFVSAGGASKENLSNFCNILHNAMKRCSRENGFVLTLNIAGSENFECKARRKILPKVRSSVKICHFEQKSHLRVLAMEEKSTCLEAHLQNKLKTAFAPIVEEREGLGCGASIQEIIFYFCASAVDEENLSVFHNSSLTCD